MSAFGPKRTYQVALHMSAFGGKARLQKNSAKVAAYCKSHKSQSLPTAIKNIGLWD